MADTSNPTIDKIKMRLEQGYTLDELRALAEKKGLMDEEVTAFFDSQMSPTPEKKKFSLRRIRLGYAKYGVIFGGWFFGISRIDSDRD